GLPMAFMTRVACGCGTNTCPAGSLSVAWPASSISCGPAFAACLASSKTRLAASSDCGHAQADQIMRNAANKARRHPSRSIDALLRGGSLPDPRDWPADCTKHGGCRHARRTASPPTGALARQLFTARCGARAARNAPARSAHAVPPRAVVAQLARDLAAVQQVVEAGDALAGREPQQPRVGLGGAALEQ